MSSFQLPYFPHGWDCFRSLLSYFIHKKTWPPFWVNTQRKFRPIECGLDVRGSDWLAWMLARTRWFMHCCLKNRATLMACTIGWACSTGHIPRLISCFFILKCSNYCLIRLSIINSMVFGTNVTFEDDPNDEVLSPRATSVVDHSSSWRHRKCPLTGWHKMCRELRHHRFGFLAFISSLTHIDDEEIENKITKICVYPCYVVVSYAKANEFGTKASMLVIIAVWPLSKLPYR